MSEASAAPPSTTLPSWLVVAVVAVAVRLWSWMRRDEVMEVVVMGRHDTVVEVMVITVVVVVVVVDCNENIVPKVTTGEGR